MAGDYPDVVIGCVGGGSQLRRASPSPSCARSWPGKKTRFVAVEPTACPTLTKGIYAYDFGDTAQMTPLLKMYTLGHDFMPAGIHAGGLRYHGMAPMLSHTYDLGLIEAVAVAQTKVFDAAQLFAQTEGIVPAPESAHAILTVIDEALAAKADGAPRNILFNLTRPRSPRPRLVRQLPGRQARGLRAPGGGDRQVDRSAAEGRLRGGRAGGGALASAPPPGAHAPDPRTETTCPASPAAQRRDR